MRKANGSVGIVGCRTVIAQCGSHKSVAFLLAVTIFCTVVYDGKF